jgi:hypothetical protein
VSETTYFLAEALRRPPAFLLRKLRDLLVKRVLAVPAHLGWSRYRSRWTTTPSVTASLLFDREVDLVSRPPVAPESLRRLRTNARRACDGVVTVLSRDVALSEDAWRRDPVSGATWPVRYHSRYRYRDLIDLDRPSDIKLPWELSRLQFVPAMVLAGLRTGDDGCRKQAASIVDAWMLANPVGWGINWTVGMEVALRAINLLWADQLARSSAGTQGLGCPRLAELLASHGRFLYRNLEYSDINGNHYTSCLLGLLYLGIALPEERESRRWRDLAARELRSEILLQTYSDGVCHEGSIPYHRLVVELFFHAFLLASRHGLDLGRDYPERLRRMLDFAAAYVKPTGRAPVWGDNDDGRVLDLGTTEVTDHRYLAGWREPLSPRPSEGASRAGMLMLLGSQMEPTAGPIAEGAARPTSTAFRQGGFFILRDHRDYCLIDCGDVGLRGRGGHGHHDLLSVELSLAGVDVLVDTGCASYTRDLQQRLATISAQAHNAPIVDGREPADLRLSRFPRAGRYAGEPLEWDAASRAFEGRHFGYARIEGVRAVGRRVVLPGGGAAVLTDRVEGSGCRSVAWCFHLADRWRPEALNGQEAVARDDEGRILRLAYDLAGLRLRVSFDQTAWYPTYAVARERTCVRIATHDNAPLPLRAVFRFEVTGPAGPTATSSE